MHQQVETSSTRHIVVPVRPDGDPQEVTVQCSDSTECAVDVGRSATVSVPESRQVFAQDTPGADGVAPAETTVSHGNRVVRRLASNGVILFQLLILVSQAALLSGVIVSWNQECAGDRNLFVWCVVTLSVAMGYLVLRLLQPVGGILGRRAMAALSTCLFVVIYFFRIGWLFYGISPVFVQSVCTGRHRAWGISLWVLELLGQLPIYCLVCLIVLISLLPERFLAPPPVEPEPTPQAIREKLPRHKYKTLQTFLEEQHALSVGSSVAAPLNPTGPPTLPPTESASANGSWILAGSRAALLDEFVGVGIAAAAAAASSSSATPSYSNNSNGNSAGAPTNGTFYPLGGASGRPSRPAVTTPTIAPDQPRPARRLQSLRSSLSTRTGSGVNVLTDQVQPATVIINAPRTRAASVNAHPRDPSASSLPDGTDNTLDNSPAAQCRPTNAEREAAAEQQDPLTASPVPTSVACPICFCDYDPDDDVIQLPCDPRHTFHEACLFSWLDKSQYCPVCRSNIVQLIEKTKSADTEGPDDQGGGG